MLKGDTHLVPREAADPFAMLRNMAADFDRFFSATRLPVFRDRITTDVAGWWPQLDVYEKNNILFARVDLPGLKREDVKIEFAERQLTIVGERKQEGEENQQNYYRRERETGTFFRTIPLPAGVKAEDVTATFAEGVLEVKILLPAAGPATQKIAITEAPAKAA